MRERATDLNGELKVRSAPGEGTTVNLTVPLSGE
jgi:signal transduction histidine kinase